MPCRSCRSCRLSCRSTSRSVCRSECGFVHRIGSKSNWRSVTSEDLLHLKICIIKVASCLFPLETSVTALYKKHAHALNCYSFVHSKHQSQLVCQNVLCNSNCHSSYVERCIFWLSDLYFLRQSCIWIDVIVMFQFCHHWKFEWNNVTDLGPLSPVLVDLIGEIHVSCRI